MICDEKLLLNYQDVFQLLVERHWSIVVPQSGKLVETEECSQVSRCN
jgi:hypothetical protein